MGYTSLMGVQPKVQLLFARSTNRITQFKYTYGTATSSGDSLGKFYLEDHWVVLDLWVSNYKCSLTWLPPPTESLGYTTYMSVPP